MATSAAVVASVGCPKSNESSSPSSMPSARRSCSVLGRSGATGAALPRQRVQPSQSRAPTAAWQPITSNRQSGGERKSLRIVGDGGKRGRETSAPCLDCTAREGIPRRRCAVLVPRGPPHCLGDLRHRLDRLRGILADVFGGGVVIIVAVAAYAELEFHLVLREIHELSSAFGAKQQAAVPAPPNPQRTHTADHAQSQRLRHTARCAPERTGNGAAGARN